jgi:hypothetical protein
MRISADPNDPGHEAYAINPRVMVFLDGDPQRGVVTADDEQGVLIRYRLDDRGMPVVEEDRFALEVKVGRVEVRAVRR